MDEVHVRREESSRATASRPTPKAIRTVQRRVFRGAVVAGGCSEADVPRGACGHQPRLQLQAEVAAARAGEPAAQAERDAARANLNAPQARVEAAIADHDRWRQAYDITGEWLQEAEVRERQTRQDRYGRRCGGAGFFSNGGPCPRH
jgi:hypothetical protein